MATIPARVAVGDYGEATGFRRARDILALEARKVHNQ
jgi:hypothetical protein